MKKETLLVLHLFAAMPLILLGLAIMLYGEKLFKFQINGTNKKKKAEL